MINGIATWLDVLLEAVETQVSVAAVVSRDLVYSTEATEADALEAPPADKFVTVTPTIFPANQGMVMGGGRPQTGFDGRVRVSMFARHQSDQEFRSGTAMKGPDGTLALTLAVLNALQLYLPVDDSGNGLLREPMRLTGFDLTPRRMRGADSFWSVVTSVWEMKFTANIGATVPA